MLNMQPSFSGGELSPSLFSRVDLQKFFTALRKLYNFIIHPHGGVSNRGGMEFLHKAKFPEKKCRIIPFEFSIEQSMVLEFGEEYIRFFKEGGLVLDGGMSIYEVVTPYQEDELVQIKTVQSADVIFIFHPNYPIKRLTRFADDNWTLDNHPVVNGPFMPISSTEVMGLYTAGGALPPSSGIFGKGTSVEIGFAVLSYFNAAHVGSIFKLNQIVQGQTQNLVLTADGSSPGMPVKGAWRVSTRGSWGGTIIIKKQAPYSGAPIETIKSLPHNSTDYNLDITGVEDELCFFSVELAYYGGGTCYLDISCDSFSLNGIVEVTSFINDKLVEGIIKSELLIAGAITSIQSWQEGSWSEYRGYPSCGGFYQDRLAAAGTKSEPQALWTSKTSNYPDFGTSSPLQATDAISINLPSRKMNAIKNLVSLSEILTFTSGSEVGIGEGGGGVFTPTTVRTKVHGYRGSSGTEPVIVGNRAIAVQAMGSIIREFGYDYNSDGYVGNDLSIFSSHLLKGFSIVEMAYQQAPDSLVWMVRSDGKLLSMTYMPEQEIVAWSWHETDGLVESICSIPGDGQNDIYIVVNRDGERFIERMTKRLASLDVKDAFFLDSAITYRGAPTDTISGLDHLEGRVVTALCDGRVVKDLTVEDGIIELPHEAEVVTVGLPYKSIFATLKPGISTQEGSSLGKTVKISEATFNFINSRGGFIGPTDDIELMDEIVELWGDDLDSPIELYTANRKQSLAEGGYNEEGSVYFVQDNPLPTTILSVIPKVNIGA